MSSRRELQRVKREHSKTLVALRTLERKMTRAQEAEVADTHEREKQLTTRLHNQNAQLKDIRAGSCCILGTCVFVSVLLLTPIFYGCV